MLIETRDLTIGWIFENQQVPEVVVYLIIGSGRLAKHVKHYLNGLLSEKDNLKGDLDSGCGAGVHQWSRKSSSLEELHQKLEMRPRVLLAIRDDAILSFYQDHLERRGLNVVHFSGSLSLSQVPGAHPLMTFGENLLSAEVYPKIHFVVSQASSLQELIPDFLNPYTLLDEKWRSFYHAQCVMGGNFTQILIQKMSKELLRLGVPLSGSRLYLEQALKAVYEKMERQRGTGFLDLRPLSGPLLRGDVKTIERNLNALSGDPFESVYHSFVTIFEELENEKYI